MHIDDFVRGKGKFIITQYVPSDEKVTRKFPLLLTTGRILSQYNVGAQTRRTENNQWHSEDRLEIHPHDAEDRGIQDGDWVGISSRAGETVLRAAGQRAHAAGRGLHDLPLPRVGRQRDHHRQLRLGDQLPRVQGHRGAGDAGRAAVELAARVHALFSRVQANCSSSGRTATRSRPNEAERHAPLPPLGARPARGCAGATCNAASTTTWWSATMVPVRARIQRHLARRDAGRRRPTWKTSRSASAERRHLDERGRLLRLRGRASRAGITVQLEVSARCFARLKERRRTLAGRTGCGVCGTESLDKVLRPVPVIEPARRSIRPRSRARCARCASTSAVPGDRRVQPRRGARSTARCCCARGRRPPQRARQADRRAGRTSCAASRASSR
jgi:hypothetical protein